MNKKLTIIKGETTWRSVNVGQLWSYRELLSSLAMRDIKVRYKQTVLGVMWAVIQPLATMVIFTLLFGRLAKIPSDGVPYPVFVFSGLLAWNFFQSSVSSGGASLLSAGSMITKVYFPRIIVPLASVGVSIVDFAISFGILLILMLLYSVPFTWQIALMPLFFLGLAVLALGLSAWLSSVTVVYRDFRFVLPFMLQMWMYLTPVIYPLSFVPQDWRWLIYLNPVAGWLEGIRACILGNTIDWVSVFCSTVLTLIIVYLGVRYFEKADRRFADVI